jgi:hypothetical protein
MSEDIHGLLLLFGAVRYNHEQEKRYRCVAVNDRVSMPRLVLRLCLLPTGLFFVTEASYFCHLLYVSRPSRCYWLRLSALQQRHVSKLMSASSEGESHGHSSR